MKLNLKPNIENESENIIITKLRDFIINKNYEPGEKLPSERTLSEKFDVSRNNIRDAIKKLEYYGLLKSIPQSGTFIADIGVIAMNGMINDILRLEKQDLKSLVETRILLETKTVELAALRRSNEDLEQIKSYLDAFTEKVLDGQEAVQEDLLFHLAIAKASRNTSMNTFMLHITPQIIESIEKYHICDRAKAMEAIKEHTAIYDAILNQDPENAIERMKVHFKVLYQYCSDHQTPT